MIVIMIFVELFFCFKKFYIIMRNNIISEIEVNSPAEHVLPLFMEIEKNNNIIIVLVYLNMHKVISTTLNLNICRGNRFKVDVIDISKQELMLAILFSLDHTLHISERTILSDFQIANQRANQ